MLTTLEAVSTRDKSMGLWSSCRVITQPRDTLLGLCQDIMIYLCLLQRSKVPQLHGLGFSHLEVLSVCGCQHRGSMHQCPASLRFVLYFTAA